MLVKLRKNSKLRDNYDQLNDAFEAYNQKVDKKGVYMQEVVAHGNIKTNKPLRISRKIQFDRSTEQGKKLHEHYKRLAEKKKSLKYNPADGTFIDENPIEKLNFNGEKIWATVGPNGTVYERYKKERKKHFVTPSTRITFNPVNGEFSFTAEDGKTYTDNPSLELANILNDIVDDDVKLAEHFQNRYDIVVREGTQNLKWQQKQAQKQEKKRRKRVRSGENRTKKSSDGATDDLYSDADDAAEDRTIAKAERKSKRAKRKAERASLIANAPSTAERLRAMDLSDDYTDPNEVSDLTDEELVERGVVPAGQRVYPSDRINYRIALRKAARQRNKDQERYGALETDVSDMSDNDRANVTTSYLSASRSISDIQIAMETAPNEEAYNQLQTEQNQQIEQLTNALNDLSDPDLHDQIAAQIRTEREESGLDQDLEPINERYIPTSMEDLSTSSSVNFKALKLKKKEDMELAKNWLQLHEMKLESVQEELYATTNEAEFEAKRNEYITVHNTIRETIDDVKNKKAKAELLENSTFAEATPISELLTFPQVQVKQHVDEMSANEFEKANELIAEISSYEQLSKREATSTAFKQAYDQLFTNLNNYVQDIPNQPENLIEQRNTINAELKTLKENAPAERSKIDIGRINDEIKELQKELNSIQEEDSEKETAINNIISMKEQLQQLVKSGAEDAAIEQQRQAVLQAEENYKGIDVESDKRPLRRNKVSAEPASPSSIQNDLIKKPEEIKESQQEIPKLSTTLESQKPIDITKGGEFNFSFVDGFNANALRSTIKALIANDMPIYVGLGSIKEVTKNGTKEVKYTSNCTPCINAKKALKEAGLTNGTYINMPSNKVMVGADGRRFTDANGQSMMHPEVTLFQQILKEELGLAFSYNEEKAYFPQIFIAKGNWIKRDNQNVWVQEFVTKTKSGIKKKNE